MVEASRGTTQAGEAGEQAPPMVEIRQLVKQFGKVRAVLPRKGFGGMVEK